MSVSTINGFPPNMYNNPSIGDYLKMLERRVARLERSTNGLDSDPTPEFVTSLTITGLALQSQTVTADQAGYKVYLRFTWNDIPSDPNAINKDEVSGYYASYTTDGVHYSGNIIDTDRDVVIGPFAQGMTVTFRVRARTKKGVYGPYASVTVVTTTDNVSPAQPSTPVVSPYLGQLMISWDGLNSTAGAMPNDFAYTEVHLSTTGSTFTPTAATLIGTLLKGGGDWIATDLNYGTTYWARLVAVDTVGNRSSSSTSGSGVPVQLVDTDITDGAVTTTKIANLAVNNAKISDLSVGKLTAGTMTVNMTVSGRIATSLSGARVEINSLGLQAFDSAGNQTVSVSSSTGDVVITGRFRTGFSGARLEMTDTTDRTTLSFFPPAGTNIAFINSPVDSGGIPTLGINSGQFSYNGSQSRHRLWLDNAFGIYLHTYRPGDNSSNGFGLYLHDDSMSILQGGLSGAAIGPALVMNATTFEMYQVTGASFRGGRLYGDDSSLWFQVFAGGSNIEVEIEHQDTGVINYHRGKFPNFIDLGAEQAIFSGGVTAASGTSWAISYGTTKTGSGVSPIATLKAGGAVGWAVTAASQSGFTVSSTATTSGAVYFWNFRV